MATSNNSSVTLIARGNIRPNTIAVGGGKGGVSNYELLTHKPSINGHELIGNKTNADLGIPTDTQDLTNTAGFITKLVDDLVNYYTKLEIDDIINQIKQSSFRIVDDLPLVGDPGVIYLILNSTPQSRNYYDEYIYVDNRWEKIGTTEIDLSGYVTDEELTQALRIYVTNDMLNEALSNYYNKADINLLLAGKANSADLAAVATSGSYNDLSNKPTIPDELADLSEDSTHRVVTDTEKQTWNNKSDFSGSYNDLTNKPVIPDELADLSDDSTHRLVTDEEKTLWTNKSSFSGSYNDLTDKPTLGTASSYDVPESGNAGTSQVVKGNDSRLSDARTPLSHTHSKADITDFPTNVSAFNNDSGFITNTVNNLTNYYLKTQTYTQTEVDNLISAAVNGRFQKVNELPSSGESNVIYLVPKADPEISNACDEYIWQDNAWELIGSTEIDLSDYVTDDDLTTALQNYLTTSAFNTAIASYYTKTEADNLLANKVDKVAGKGLSTNDYDNTAKNIVDGVTSALNDKVDKEIGKGLSTNDYTTVEKNKLAGISSNATKTESSETNGNIKIDNVEIQVYNDTVLQNKTKNNLITLTDDSPLEFTTQSKQVLTNLSVELEDPDLYQQHFGNIPWSGGQSRNLCPVYDSGNFSVNKNDWFVSYSGQGDSRAWNYNSSQWKFALPAGTYKIIWEVTTIADNGANELQVYNSSNTRILRVVHAFSDLGIHSDTFTVDGESGSETWIGIMGKQYAGVARYMIVDASDTSTEFTPYINLCNIRGTEDIVINVAANSTAIPKTYTIHYEDSIFGGIVNYNHGKIQATDFQWIESLNNLINYGTYSLIHDDSWPQNCYAIQDTEWYPIVENNDFIFEDMLSNQFPIKSVNAILAGEVGLGMGTEQRVFFNLGDGETYNTESRVKEYLSRWDIKFTYHGYGEYTTIKSTSQIIELLEGDNYITISATTKGIKDILSLKYKDGIFAGLEDIPTKVSELEYDVVDVDTWRPIRVNGSYILSRITTSSPLNFVNGNNTTITHTGNGDVTFSSNDTYERNRYSGQIKAGAAVTAGNIIVAKDGAYHNLKDGTAFDITFPILYASQNIISGNFNTQTYDQYLMVINATQSMTLERLPVYIKGTLVGTVFTPVSTTPLTQVEPTTEDGYYYILLGCAISTNGLYLQAHHPIYSYKNGAFSENTKVESSTINGNIKIDGTETIVYDDSELQNIVSTDEVTIEGNPLNFNTLSSQNAKSTILSLEPIQDLHGFTKPWVGGASINLFDCTISGGSYIKNGVTYTNVSDSDGNVLGVKAINTATDYASLDIPVSLSAGRYKTNVIQTNDTVVLMVRDSSLGWLANANAEFTLNEATTVYIRYAVVTGVNANCIVNCMLYEYSGTDKSFVPYANICPISGRTEIGILGCGKNRFNKNDGMIVANRRISTSTGGLYNADGYSASYHIEITGSTVYTLTTVSGFTSYCAWYDSEKHFISGSAWTSGYINTSPANAKYVKFDFSTSNIDTVQLELGSTPTTYESFVESTDLTISFGQTVYGGTLDVENGVLVVDKASKKINDASFNWQIHGTYHSVIYSYDYADKAVGLTNVISSAYYTTDAVSVDRIPNGAIRGHASVGSIYIRDDAYELNLQGFLSARGNEDICYELATPITINLTPHTINLLKGVNNISTDGNKITLTYRDGSVATLGDLTSAVDNLDSKIDESKILTDTATGDKYILVVTNGVLSVQQVSN